VVGLRDLFAKLDPGATAGEIIRWWEARRLHYNVIILAWGVLWATISYLGGNHLWLDPVMILTYLLVIQFPANILYVSGWILDLIVKRVLRLRWSGFGPWAFGLGVGFSFVFIIVVIFVGALMLALIGDFLMIRLSYVFWKLNDLRG
jgi:hypothetical protein